MFSAFCMNLLIRTQLSLCLFYFHLFARIRGFMYNLKWWASSVRGLPARNQWEFVCWRKIIIQNFTDRWRSHIMLSVLQEFSPLKNLFFFITFYPFLFCSRTVIILDYIQPLKESLRSRQFNNKTKVLTVAHANFGKETFHVTFYFQFIYLLFFSIKINQEKQNSLEKLETLHKFLF